MVLVACVLECSSIGAISLLTIFVATTRVGVNKNIREKDNFEKVESKPISEQPTHRTHPSQIGQPTTKGEVLLMWGIVAVLAVCTTVLVTLLSQWF